MRFLKQLCIPPRSHFKCNTGNTQRWHRSMAWLTVFVMALTFAALARPTLVNAAVQYNQRIQFQDDFDSCLGERILVDGTQHIVGRVLEDATGRLHFGFTRNTYGTGIGYTSGDQYLLTDTVSRSSTEVVAGGAQIFTEQYQAHLIRRGEAATGDDTLVHFLTKIIINANGDLSAEVEIQNVICR